MKIGVLLNSESSLYQKLETAGLLAIDFKAADAQKDADHLRSISARLRKNENIETETESKVDQSSAMVAFTDGLRNFSLDENEKAEFADAIDNHANLLIQISIVPTVKADDEKKKKEDENEALNKEIRKKGLRALFYPFVKTRELIASIYAYFAGKKEIEINGEKEKVDGKEALKNFLHLVFMAWALAVMCAVVGWFGIPLVTDWALASGSLSGMVALDALVVYLGVCVAALAQNIIKGTITFFKELPETFPKFISEVIDDLKNEGPNYQKKFKTGMYYVFHPIIMTGKSLYNFYEGPNYERALSLLYFVAMFMTIALMLAVKADLGIPGLTEWTTPSPSDGSKPEINWEIAIGMIYIVVTVASVILEYFLEEVRSYCEKMDRVEDPDSALSKPGLTEKNGKNNENKNDSSLLTSAYQPPKPVPGFGQGQQQQPVVVVTNSESNKNDM